MTGRPVEPFQGPCSIHCSRQSITWTTGPTRRLRQKFACAQSSFWIYDLVCSLTTSQGNLSLYHVNHIMSSDSAAKKWSKWQTYGFGETLEVVPRTWQGFLTTMIALRPTALAGRAPQSDETKYYIQRLLRGNVAFEIGWRRISPRIVMGKPYFKTILDGGTSMQIGRGGRNSRVSWGENYMHMSHWGDMGRFRSWKLDGASSHGNRGHTLCWKRFSEQTREACGENGRRGGLRRFCHLKVGIDIANLLRQLKPSEFFVWRLEVTRAEDKIKFGDWPV